MVAVHFQPLREFCGSAMHRERGLKSVAAKGEKNFARWALFGGAGEISKGGNGLI
jgi:hypothetical protein